MSTRSKRSASRYGAEFMIKIKGKRKPFEVENLSANGFVLLTNDKKCKDEVIVSISFFKNKYPTPLNAKVTRRNDNQIAYSFGFENDDKKKEFEAWVQSQAKIWVEEHFSSWD